ncbi:hypothetical protein KY314_03450 [Candidatus Woesearchaeota archaeon]|nr:hypothetical protein [Candidatus Woesearchaeota archaeon]
MVKPQKYEFSDPTDLNTLGKQIDYETVIFRHLDRTLEKGLEDDVTFIRGINILHHLLAPKWINKDSGYLTQIEKCSEELLEKFNKLNNNNKNSATKTLYRRKQADFLLGRIALLLKNKGALKPEVRIDEIP